MEGLNKDENSTKMAMADNIGTKKIRHMDFAERITKFYGIKYSRRYSFKIILEVTQEIPEVYLAQHFLFF